MFRKTLAIVGGAAILAMAMVSTASAQANPEESASGFYSAPREAVITAPTARVTPTRTPARTRREEAPPPPTAEENMAAAQQIASAAGVGCQVTEASLLGLAPDQSTSYEAACATGPGYVLIGSAPPQAVDCVLLAGQAELDRARDPAANVGTQCVLPQNMDVVRVVSVYAREAGIPCAVDQGASIGKSTTGNLIYEIGCNGADGYWIEKAGATWTKTECAVIATQNASCRYTTAAEQLATFRTRLAGSEAAACDVTEGRYMGANANGAFWEAKCGGGNGVIVRFNPAYAVQQVYPCETAQRIGGGCRLTVVPEAPAG